MPEELDEDRVQYVAKALYDSAVQNTIEAVEKKTLDHQRMRSIARKVQKESDRSCAIILYSLADEILQDLIIQECNQDIPDLRRRMFGQFDMLPNPSSRMFFAFALRWMTRATFHNLNIVRKMRNKFAHDIDCDTFTCSGIRGHITSLAPTHRSRVEAVLSTLEDEVDPKILSHILQTYDEKARLFFILEFSVLLDAMISELCVFPESTRHGVSALDVIRHRDRVPSNIREVRYSTAVMVLETIDATFSLGLKRGEKA